jgi:hypothetical protein
MFIIVSIRLELSKEQTKELSKEQTKELSKENCLDRLSARPLALLMVKNEK